MTYISLYRKWRPQTFAEIVGQDHVVATLQNALQTGQVHHALLFCGTRGTGKTSTARILAKALNCERGPAPEPCNECASCLAITAGTSLDVVEIDAASHGSVDDARELRERASYAPAASRFKVYIVDEAHMVTTQGFNAMLKVLEEPPGHVRFVFATTEPHKVIEAIRSRCQRHDFRRVPTRLIAEHLARVCAAEAVTIEPAAVELLARAGDGSVRDALSRLDQVLTFASGNVTLGDVAKVLGVLPVELRYDLGDALAGHRVPDLLEVVHRVVEGGHDLRQFAREALEHVRDLLVLQLAPDREELVDVTPETRERLAAQAGRFGPGELSRLVRLLGEVSSDLRTATDQRLVLEVGLVRAALPAASLDADALLARIERLERRFGVEPEAAPAGVPLEPVEVTLADSGAGADEPARASAGAAPATEAPSVAGGAPSPDRGPPSPERAPDLDLELVRRTWPVVLEHVARRSRVAATFLEPGEPIALAGRQVVVEFGPQSRFHGEGLQRDGRKELVDAVLQELLGGELAIRVELGGPGDRTSFGPAGGAGAGGPGTVGGAVAAGGAAPGGAGAGPTEQPGEETGDASRPAEEGHHPGEAVQPADGGGHSRGQSGQRRRRGSHRRDQAGDRPAEAGRRAEQPPGGSPGEGSAEDGAATEDGAGIDPAADPGEPLGPDADTRAVADLVGRAFGGEIIEQRPRKRGGP